MSRSAIFRFKEKEVAVEVTPKSWTLYFKLRIEFCIAQDLVLLM